MEILSIRKLVWVYLWQTQDCKMKRVTNGKDKHFMKLKGSFHQEDNYLTVFT